MASVYCSLSRMQVLLTKISQTCQKLSSWSLPLSAVLSTFKGGSESLNSNVEITTWANGTSSQPLA